jgi:hypothetical protein
MVGSLYGVVSLTLQLGSFITQLAQVLGVPTFSVPLAILELDTLYLFLLGVGTVILLSSVYHIGATRKEKENVKNGRRRKM